MPKNQCLFKVVIVEPEIPQNTGNIGRTCVGLDCELHLVGPMSFEITDKNVKRAGLDYWPHLTWRYHNNYAEWLSTVPDGDRIFFIENKVEKTIYEADFKRGDWLVFGQETKGLRPEIVQENKDKTYLIPQTGPIRSLNLATAVAITLYEGYRQITHRPG